MPTLEVVRFSLHVTLTFELEGENLWQRAEILCFPDNVISLTVCIPFQLLIGCHMIILMSMFKDTPVILRYRCILY